MKSESEMKRRTIDELRLRTFFRRAMLVALTGAGCSTKDADSAAAPAGDDAGVDAASETGAPLLDAGKEAAPLDPCAPTAHQPQPPDTCGDYVRFPCGLPSGLSLRGDCYFAVNDCASLCPDIHYNCHAIESYCRVSTDDAGDPDASLDGVVVPDEAGAVIIDCSICPGSAGRVPAGLVHDQPVSARSRLGAYFANAARLEAASVTAFRRLHDELALHDAPHELLEAARAAEHDEVRHTLAMARLARRHGGRYTRPTVADVAPRSLLAVAEENAVEGCARETFGALLATWQAEHTTDAGTARVLRTVADDETRHAALSWSIARWSLEQLDAGARARLAQSWSAAVDALVGEDAGAAVAALPSHAQRQELATSLRGLWAELLAA